MRRLVPAAVAAAACAVAGCGTGQAGTAILHVETRCREVALTFDDGPFPGTTPRLLRLLEAHAAAATFFDVGRRARARPDLVARELAAGDQVGDHSFDHARLPLLSGSQLAAEFSRARAALRAAGARVRVFRPPFGFFDGRVQAAARARGETLIGWDLVLEPGRRDCSATAVARAAQPGSIILAHDVDAAAVAPLLRGLRARGLRSVTVSQLLSAGAGCSPRGRAPA